MWEWMKEKTWTDKEVKKGIKRGLCKLTVMIFAFSIHMAGSSSQEQSTQCFRNTNLSVDNLKETHGIWLMDHGVFCFAHVL